MALTLVILAAGLGSRYGGKKQVAEVGPLGQYLFEYSVYDACQSGFDHIVFVVNQEQDPDQILSRIHFPAGSVKIDLAVQTIKSCLDSKALQRVNAQRTKPWGTAHAVLAAQPYIDNPFVVINADDFYGASSFKLVANYLQAHRNEVDIAVTATYELGNTLSDSGGVNRGVCIVDQQGYLESVREVKNIGLDASMTLRWDEDEVLEFVRPDDPVSMTFWGFQPSIFESFAAGFSEFFNQSGSTLDEELYIPLIVDQAIRSRLCRMRALPTTEQWMGMTYPTDLAVVRENISLLTDAGVYPRSFDQSQS